MPPAQQPAKKYVVGGADADDAPIGVVGVLGIFTITEETIVGYRGGSVGAVIVKLAIVVASGGAILIIAGGSRIGITGKSIDGVGSIGIVKTRSLLLTSQTNHCVNLWSKGYALSHDWGRRQSKYNAYHLLELLGLVLFAIGVLRQLAMTKGQPYRACAVPNRKSNQKD